nr:extracellular solute-binding protein [Marinicella sp. W31]MDC2879904.1 extracellular solute-binding protein [Marinicella sp. W31]
MAKTLKGLTWSHPRGFDPLEAASRQWRAETGVCITWEKGTQQDFTDVHTAELAKAYDLLIIDHTHLGRLTQGKCLLPLDIEGREDARREVERGAVGATCQSFHFRDRQWAFPIDASAEVMAFRHDRAPEVPADWEALMHLARKGKVLLSLRTPHALMVFFTIAAGLGTPCRAEQQGPLIGEDEGIVVYEYLAELARLVPEENLTMDPVAVLERLASGETKASVAPFISGYVNYAVDGFRANRLAFTSVPAINGDSPASSTLGGTGIAVSAASSNAEEALDFCHWIASGPVQSTLYAEAGGQPAHKQAWESAEVNDAVYNFYRQTREAVEHAFVRPRHDGYHHFQQEASDVIIEALRTDVPPIAVIGRLNKLFEDSFSNGSMAEI